MLSILDFLTVSHLKSMTYYIMALRSVKTSHATTNMAVCILAEISAYCSTKDNANETI